MVGKITKRFGVVALVTLMFVAGGCDGGKKAAQQKSADEMAAKLEDMERLQRQSDRQVREYEERKAADDIKRLEDESKAADERAKAREAQEAQEAREANIAALEIKLSAAKERQALSHEKAERARKQYDTVLESLGKMTEAERDRAETAFQKMKDGKDLTKKDIDILEKTGLDSDEYNEKKKAFYQQQIK